jgi:integrase
MASISRESNGRKTIQFIGTDKKRRSLRLGKASLEYARTIKNHVESIMAATRKAVSVSAETAEWLGKVDDEFHEQLAGVGLAENRVKPEAQPERTLGLLISEYNAHRLKAKEGTRTAWGQTQRNLKDKFGEDKPIADITVADAENWEEWLEVDQQLGDQTARRRCGHAKQFFEFAVKSKWIAENPFDGLDSIGVPNRDKDFFITRAMASLVLDACPDHEWRLIFALSRYGGLRCSSEHLAFRLGDIFWERDRMRIRSPKTEHHKGHESRIVPIFPELLPYLLESAEAAQGQGSQFLVNRYRSSQANLRTQLHRIIRRAGLEPWPKTFQNLRATRQTELEERFPTHVVCVWLGNSERVARRNYLQVTEDHFTRAKAVQKAVQHVGTENHIEPREQLPANENGQLARRQVAVCGEVRSTSVVVAGFEPATPSM